MPFASINYPHKNYRNRIRDDLINAIKECECEEQKKRLENLLRNELESKYYSVVTLEAIADLQYNESYRMRGNGMEPLYHACGELVGAVRLGTDRDLTYIGMKVCKKCGEDYCFKSLAEKTLNKNKSS